MTRVKKKEGEKTHGARPNQIDKRGGGAKEELEKGGGGKREVPLLS